MCYIYTHFWPGVFELVQQYESIPNEYVHDHSQPPATSMNPGTGSAPSRCPQSILGLVCSWLSLYDHIDHKTTNIKQEQLSRLASGAGQCLLHFLK